MNIIAPQEFDYKKIQITNPTNKKTDNGTFFAAYFNYDNKPSVYLKTPQSKTPFGCNDFKGDNKYKLQLDIEDTEWLDHFRNIDILMIEWALKHWKEIPCFKKKPSRDMVEDKYNGFVKEPEADTAYAPKMKFSFTTTRWNDKLKDENDEPISQDAFKPKPNFEIYSSDGTEVVIKRVSELPEVIPRGSHVRMCFEMKIWSMAATGFGVTLKALTMQVTKSDYAKPTGNIWAESPKEETVEQPPVDSSEDGSESGSGSGSGDPDPEQ